MPPALLSHWGLKKILAEIRASRTACFVFFAHALKQETLDDR